MDILQLAVHKLANTMRMYTETSIHVKNLKHIDLEEAIGNLDRAFESKLEAFHSLYDVSKKYLDFFAYADTASLIMLRNAIHHRDHLLFKSWNHEMVLESGLRKHLGAEFLLIDYPTLESPSHMYYFYKLEDFYLRIDESMGSPFLEKKMGTTNRQKLLDQINSDLYFKKIQEYADSKNYPLNQIYINVMPIFVAATCRIFKALKENGVQFEGFDAKTYEEPFTNELKVDFSKFTYKPCRIPMFL